MKYSLRSLMIVVTLACIVAAIGGRCLYLHRMAAFHDSEGFRIAMEERASSQEFMRNAIATAQHWELAKRYREVVWRPWTIVDANPPEIDSTEVRRTIEVNGLEKFFNLDDLPNSSAPALNPPTP
jgi:hypothetical protein